MASPPVDFIQPKPAAVMVVGGGIGGMRSALDLADSGLKVYLIEQTPCLGGRVAQLGYMFPQHDCVLCRGTPDHGYGCTRPSISPAYIQNNQHPNIEVLTSTSVLDIEGQAGDFTISLRGEPRYVDMNRCINCGYCAEVCPVELPDSYQQGMTMHKAAYKVAARAIPDAYVIERGPYCEDCGKCVEICPTGAIDLNEKPRLHSIEVGAIILALGFQAYDPTEMEELGYRRYPNVLHAMDYERLASRSGPTEGIILRPSDQRKPNSIAWLQCIGSRDRRNTYCSSICCMYTTKEAILAKQRLGKEVDCTVFIMDERTFNKEYNAYFEKAQEQHHIQYIRCRVSQIREDPQSSNLILHYAHPDGYQQEQTFEMVVLATGLQPPQSAHHFTQLLDLELNRYGFCQTDKFTPLHTSHSGVFVCGAFSSPKEIVETIIDASGAAGEVMRLLNDRLNTFIYSREWPFLSMDGLPPERDVSLEAPRVGVFTCNCGGSLSRFIDINNLMEQASRWPAVVAVEQMDYACFPEGLTRLRNQIEEQGLNRVVIVGCSNRTHDSLFQRSIRQAGLNPYLMELVNLREQCTRVHVWQEAQANRKALELTRIAVGRSAKSQAVHKKKYICQPRALIVGGGLSGMTAALAIADSGYEVHIVERSHQLGGNLQDMYYVAEGYNPRRLGRDLINRVRAHQNITALTHTEVVGHQGHVGFYQTEVETRRPGSEAQRFSIEHGVTIIATGGREAQDHPWLGLTQVITQRDLEAMVIHNPEKIAALEDVVMIQCVRPYGAPDYCSRVCCTNTIKNAIRLKLFNPNCRVSVLYKNIITYGFREEYYTKARELGVVFIRYTDEELPKIETSGGRVTVMVRDQALNRQLALPADVVPLSMSILPAEGIGELAEIFNVPLSSEGFFKEAQIKLRPMDFMRDGFFLAGMAHYPKFIEESISHALAAAGRALTILSQRDSLFLGGVVAVVDPEKCVGCLTCTRTCPFSIPQVIQLEGRSGVGNLGGAAYIDEALCQGCGTCTGECPANAIQLVNYTDEQIMLREIGGLGAWLPWDSERLSVVGSQ
ncbi:MAG: CoB--CoM heterodisulfide reductase iron-sulfur subunit A family protein [Chloroflexi bacterium]|nr:CoB--CoM heterodisulfide reductase iron-sulfur subunit A family protein [Chloroflexota bacterium]